MADDKNTQGGNATQTSAPVKTLAAAAVVQPMMDDQKTVMHVTPLDSNGKPTSLPTGSAPPVYTTDHPELVSLAPGIDATGLSCGVVGVKGASGTAVVTATFTNADGTTAIGSAEFDMTIDPKELDVNSLGVTVDTPVAQ